jgi:thiol:disulfide interchange protein
MTEGRPETLDKETIMNTSISTKLTALALALVFNGAIMGGMAYLFNAQLQQPTAVASLASTVANTSNDVA